MMIDMWILLTGALVATSCAILGCFLILRRMAMVGDAISHAVLPGIVIAFLIAGTRDSLPMLLGASVIGMVTVFLIQCFKNSGVPTDASIGVVFTALFSIGVILVSLYASQVDLDLDCVLFGEIGLVPFDRLWIGETDFGPKAVWGLGITLLVVMGILSLFYKHFKICSFDPGLAVSLGIPVALFHYLLMGLVSMTTVASFESVGAILVVGMLGRTSCHGLLADGSVKHYDHIERFDWNLEQYTWVWGFLYFGCFHCRVYGLCSWYPICDHFRLVSQAWADETLLAS